MALRYALWRLVSVVVLGKFVLRIGREELLVAHGGRSVLGCVGFTSPGRDARARGKAGEEVVQGNRGLGPSVLACRLREAFDAGGHVGHERRPLRAGRGAAAAEGARGHGWA